MAPAVRGPAGRLGLCEVDELAEEHAVGDDTEELADLPDGQQVGELRLGAQLGVDEVGEGHALLLREGVDGRVLPDLQHGRLLPDRIAQACPRQASRV